MNNDFDRAVNFLQGALNAAAFEVAKEQQAAKEPEPVVAKEPPVAKAPVITVSGNTPKIAPEEPSVPPVANNPLSGDQLELQLGPLPEPEELSKPEDEPIPESTTVSVDNQPTSQTASVSLNRLVAGILVAFCTVVAGVAACKLISPRTITQEVVKEVQIEPDGIPFALLPDTADATLWETVSNLHGKIGNAELQFKRGLAEANGTVYKVCLDFCQSKGDLYVKIAGNGFWVVRASSDGTIIKAYPAKSNGKPLKEIFKK